MQGKLHPEVDVAGALVLTFLAAGEGDATAGAAGEVAFLAGAGTEVDDVRGPTGKGPAPVAGDVLFPAAVVLAFVPDAEVVAASLVDVMLAEATEPVRLKGLTAVLRPAAMRHMSDACLLL